MIVAGAVIEVDVPAVVAAPAGVPQDRRLPGVPSRHLGVVGRHRVHLPAVAVPEAVAAPRVERPVVAGLLDRVEDVAELDDVAAPAAVADVDARARHVVDAAMADRDLLGHRDLDAGGLFFHAADAGDEAVVHAALGGVVGGLRPRRLVHLVERHGPPDLVGRRAHRAGVAHEADAAGPRLGDPAPGYLHAAVVVIDKYRVAAGGVEEAVGHRAVPGALQENGAAAADRPVAAEERLPGVHEGAGGVREAQAPQRDEPHGALLAAAELEEAAEARRLDPCLGQVQALRRHEEEDALRAVEVPLAGRVELLEDVLDEADALVHAHLSIILPAAFELELALLVDAGDAVMEAAPLVGVQGVDEPAGGVGPPLDALGADGVGGAAVEVPRRRVVVGVAGHGLAPAVDEKLVEVDLAVLHARHRGLEDAVLVVGPLEVGPGAAAHGRLFARVRRVDDRRPGGAGVLGLEHDRLAQVPGAGAEEHGHGARGLRLACRRLRLGECGEGQGLRAGVGIGAAGGDVERGFRAGRGRGQGQGQPQGECDK